MWLGPKKPFKPYFPFYGDHTLQKQYGNGVFMMDKQHNIKRNIVKAMHGSEVANV